MDGKAMQMDIGHVEGHRRSELFCWKFAKRTITRTEGAILLVAYIAYIANQVVAVAG